MFEGSKWDYLPVVKSKMRSINDMVLNLRIHKEEMEKIREKHLNLELEYSYPTNIVHHRGWNIEKQEIWFQIIRK